MLQDDILDTHTISIVFLYVTVDVEDMFGCLVKTSSIQKYYSMKILES